MSSQLQWASRRIADLEAENARLQANVKEARDFLASALRNVDLARVERDQEMANTDEALVERDHHKALAERRGEATRTMRNLLHSAEGHIDSYPNCRNVYCRKANAAIAAPEKGDE